MRRWSASRWNDCALYGRAAIRTLAGCLKQVEDAARSGANLMPHIVAAVEAYATVGEISDTLAQGVWGIQRDGSDLGAVAGRTYPVVAHAPVNP